MLKFLLLTIMFQRYDAPTSDSSEQASKRQRLQSEAGSYSSSSPDSSSASPSGSPSSSEGEDCGPAISKPSGLLLSQLVSMNEGNLEQESVFGRQACEPARIKSVLKESCCKRNCKRMLHWKLVLKMVTYFWALPKVSQDSLLWSLQQNSFDAYDSQDSESESDNDASKHKISWSIEGAGFDASCSSSLWNVLHLAVTVWHFLGTLRAWLAGHSVCRQSFLRLLGISASRLVRTRRTFKGTDGRTLGSLSDLK